MKIETSIKKLFLHLLILFCLLCYFPLPYGKIAAAENQPSWVKAKGNTLVKDDKPFKFIGASAVNLVFYDDWNLDIEKAIRTAKENNISVIRLYIDLGWGKSEDFDRIFDIASKHGIYVILAFTDCCCSSDYQNLTKYFEVHAPFCNITNRESVNAFKKLIKQIIQRKNSINGKIYRDDPVILAWEIANELEYRHFSEPDVRKWIEEMSSYIKTIDKNHLVTIGIDTSSLEFSGESLPYLLFNSPDLDFFSLHYYPASGNFNAGESDPIKQDLSKMEFIIKKFSSLRKPVVMGEFGIANSIELTNDIRRSKPEFYNLRFKEIMDSAFSAGVSGAMFWGWGIAEEKKAPMWWAQESHNASDYKFCVMLQKYNIYQWD